MVATPMERPGLFLNFLVVSTFTCFFSCTHGELFIDNFDNKLTALFNVVDYVHRRPEQMNADAAFGITMTEANLAAVLLHKNSRYLEKEHRNILRTILKLCDSTRLSLKSRIISHNENVQLLHETLNDPALWIRRISWRKHMLREIRGPSPGLTSLGILRLTMQGRPKEEESDECLAEIVQSKLKGECRFPERCRKIISDENRSRGYPLTHKLLVVEVAQALQCEEDISSDFSDLTFNYCSAILQDLTDLEAAGFPYNTRDLFTEQVLLCGMEGFLEFTGKPIEDLILSWAHPSGCFSSFGFPKKGPSLVRRSSTRTDFGCDSHATGLGAASLSLLIRENVENALNLRRI